MWKRIKLFIIAVKDFVFSMFENSLQNVSAAIDKLSFWCIPIGIVAILIMLYIPQLAVFAAIASLTSGIQDPLVKFVAGIGVFTIMEFLLVTIFWPIVAVLGLSELLRFAKYIRLSYEKRLNEEEVRESEGEDLTLGNLFKRAKDHSA